MAAHKILLADDSVTIRKVVELTFADEGIEVVSVADGDAAMKKFVEIEPDMVIADVNMPGMSGYQICEMIKADESTRHIPVILLVGSFEPFDPGEASRVGSNYYFTKPFSSIRELVEKVTEYLELGAAAEMMAPETADIEDLYNESFQTTVEVPRPEEESEQIASGYDEIGVEAEPEIEAEAPEPATREPYVPYDSGEYREPEAAVQDVEPVVLEPEVEQHTTPAEPEQELGDAGMDDEMIETSHPGVPEAVETTEPAASPFNERVDEIELTPEAEQEASVARFDWSGGKVQAVEDVPAVEPGMSPLRFTIDDAEPTPVAATEEVQFAPREEPEADREQVSQSNVSPELVEMIVRSVLEKMSDRVVRDVAQEAVPRIAEKLIREALEEEKKK